FDDGRVTDAHGHTVDFRNTVIVMTSNVSGDPTRAQRRVGFGAESQPKQARALEVGPLKDALFTFFRPELINRISRVIQFHPLGAEQARKIIDKVLERIRARASKKSVRIEMTKEAYDALLRVGFRPEWGAREIE